MQVSGKMSLLPGRGPCQAFEAWLRVSGKNNVVVRPKGPVTQHHLQIQRKPGGDLEESFGVKAGCPLVYDGEGVRVEDHQGKEVANEVFPEALLASKSMPHSHRVTLVFINKVGAEGTFGFPSVEIVLSFVGSLGGSSARYPCMLGGGAIVEGVVGINSWISQQQ